MIGHLPKSSNRTVNNSAKNKRDEMEKLEERMPFLKKAPVYISVYVVRPGRSAGNCNGHHHHNHHRVHHHIHGGCNRKAELLRYSQQLRASARREQACPAPKPTSGKIVLLHRNLSTGRNPSCLGNCKRRLMLSCLLKSHAIFKRNKEKKTSVKVQANVEEQQGLVKKLISVFGPRK